MRYWDASAIVPLLINQKFSKRSIELLKTDRRISTWWGTEIECASAITRAGRDKLATAEEVRAAFDQLGTVQSAWNVVEPTARLKPLALRLLRTHNLRASDALQLACGIESSGGRPDTLEFVCFDHRLNDAARKEGFRVLS